MREWKSSADGPRSLLALEEPISPRFLSRDRCRALGDRVFGMAVGGGSTTVNILSYWTRNLRWARNQVTTGGDLEDTMVTVSREIRGVPGLASTNALDDATLKATVGHAERLTEWRPQLADEYPVPFPDVPMAVHPTVEPHIWFDRTNDLSAEARAQIVEPLVARAAERGFLAAGYIEINAAGEAVVRSAPAPLMRYYPRTMAQFSVTVRDSRGTCSGWAGVDFADWQRIDTAALTQIAIDKCERSRNPVAIEPGRLTAILEPQAVADLFSPVMNTALDRDAAERGRGVFASERQGFSKIGEKVLDERLTVTADPMDPDLGFMPFDWFGEPNRNTTWFERGILKALSYSRYYAIAQLQSDWALPNSGAWRMSGGTATIDDMIATTERGVLVTRLSNVVVLDNSSLVCRGVTRDGLWLIERGKVSKSIKNFNFTESPMFAFNNVEALGVPQRVFHPSGPVVCPPIKVRDFNFSGLTDAV